MSGEIELDEASFGGPAQMQARPHSSRHLKVDRQKDFSSGKVYINGPEGFWSWAKERLIKHRGVSKTHFPLYLKELGSRYHPCTGDLFDPVANCLCDRVPTREQLPKSFSQVFAPE